MNYASEKQRKFAKKLINLKAKKTFRKPRDVMDDYRIDYLDTMSKEKASHVIEVLIAEGYGPDKNWGR